MANPLSKGWKYLTSSLDQKIDEHADPEVQIQQAAEASRAQHQQLSEQAAQVVGNRNQLEMKLNRLAEDQAKLQEKARTSLKLADDASDPAKAQEYMQAAEIYATQLVSVEQQLEETKQLHQQAAQAAEEASKQLKASEARLQEQLGSIDQMRSQLQQTKMQEATAKSVQRMGELQPDGSVPTLDQVRDKIERRYANALGAQELAEHSIGDQMAQIEATATDMRASAKLDEIRQQMAGELSSGQGGAHKAIAGAQEQAAAEAPHASDATLAAGSQVGDTSDEGAVSVSDADAASASEEEPKQ